MEFIFRTTKAHTAQKRPAWNKVKHLKVESTFQNGSAEVKNKKPRSLRQQILGGLGKAWMYYSPRLEAKKRAKHPTKKGWYICELCKGEREKIEIDHVVPCIRPADGFTTWDDYISSRFVESASQLQSLCHECHQTKSKEENRLRREMKKSNKKVTGADLDVFADKFINPEKK